MILIVLWTEVHVRTILWLQVFELFLFEIFLCNLTWLQSSTSRSQLLCNQETPSTTDDLWFLQQISSITLHLYLASVHPPLPNTSNNFGWFMVSSVSITQLYIYNSLNRNMEQKQRKQEPSDLSVWKKSYQNSWNPNIHSRLTNLRLISAG